ncbi:hypothetical protein DFR74_11348 [Nocardia puris]|uniref:Prevent-host-death family protein n=1 Tax=Nocardia puris TaxID=208602 RepID=A0A366D986_9NOCA|nr:hypothetical protein DFR74_11348 [Nocardia puris]
MFCCGCAAVEAGESFTITRDGQPVAELKPLSWRGFVPVSELARTSARIPRIDYAEWHALPLPPRHPGDFKGFGPLLNIVAV